MSSNGGSGSRSAVVTQTAAPVVLVKSPQVINKPDNIFISQLPPRNIINSKRNINIHNNNAHTKLHTLSSHNRYPFFRNTNFQPVESSYYFVPKSPPKPPMDPVHYTTNFNAENPEVKPIPEIPPHKPVRFPQLQESEKELPIVKRLDIPSHTTTTQTTSTTSTSTTTTTTTTSTSTTTTTTTTSTSSTTTLPPLLPAFHPDYKPTPLTLQSVTETEIKRSSVARENVPRFKHSARYQESLGPYQSVYNQLLPAFHPDYKRPERYNTAFRPSESIVNYVTPSSTFSPRQSQSRVGVSTTESLSPLIKTTKLLYSSLGMNDTTRDKDVDLENDLKTLELAESSVTEERESETLKVHNPEEMYQHNNETDIEGSSDIEYEDENATDMPLTYLVP